VSRVECSQHLRHSTLYTFATTSRRVRDYIPEGLRLHPGGFATTSRRVCDYIPEGSRLHPGGLIGDAEGFATTFQRAGDYINRQLLLSCHVALRLQLTDYICSRN
jgi:hypothetical protein